VKRVIVSQIFQMAGAVIAGSSGTVEYLKSLGVPKNRIFLGGNTVDNEWWTERSEQVDRTEFRRTWKIPAEAPVVLYCAKLQPWKRPGDLLAAFSQAGVPGSFLVLAGDGPLRASLEAQAANLGILDRVRFLGFVNQSGLPSVYTSFDLLILPSDYEPFGLVVNEAMLCGCPAVVSDRVGAKYDLIREGETGRVFSCGDVDGLAKILRAMLSDRSETRRMGALAKERMKSWTPQMNVAAFVKAVEYSLQDKARTNIEVSK
jgi:glycosyltransferase involved in cell wall biosynthesis